MTLMLAIAIGAFLLAFFAARIVAKSVKKRFWSWLAVGSVAVLPTVALYAGIRHSSQMVGWGLLLLVPASIAWALGWIVCFAYTKCQLVNGS
ncbi:hypothetical protein [Sphingomonas kyeonggiensis]|uniref:Putative membrane protein n=1 Tax=Sphingomonas kyeonggiensis TaxID=1268553 RepID=A0A7W6JS34_9SPHN|nr:hypothetical protein [Sphingomonas kyeonggiensis]MBB4097442.1 putative membrane protein [Sphingomonas kyeonggiensis]